ncbi:MAG TPA: PrsW family glutamic-type intramembrane protease [Anaerolineae bacterium]|nr:PrsW family glutamic-type intramembrane protease [Anaerolineae bacterium]
MSHISFQCSNCQNYLRTQAKAAGLTIKCPVCEDEIVVPTETEAVAEEMPEVEKGGDTGFDAGAAVKDFGNAFRELDYQMLFPLNRILNLFRLRHSYVQWVLLLGLAPLLLFQMQVGLGLGFEQTVWLIQLYFCALWVIYINRLLQPEGEGWKRPLAYGLFTLTTGLPLLLFTRNLPVINGLTQMDATGGLLAQLTYYIGGVGIMEELTKALPLLFFGLYRGGIRNGKEGLFLGFMSGVAFALAEGVQYTILTTMYGAPSIVITQLIFRLMTGPLLHGALAGIVGWFIGMSAREERRWPTVAVGVLLAGVMHGLYNTFAMGWLGVLMAGFIFVTFLMYTQYEVPVEVE